MKRTVQRYVGIVLLALLAGAALFEVVQKLQMDHEAIAIGSPAPAIVAQNTNGQEVRLFDYRGKPVLVQFWGSWCTSCVNEMPLIDQAAKRRGIQVLGINVGQTRGTVKTFIDKLGITYPQLLDPSGDIMEAYQVKALPVTVLIDSEQKVAQIVTGQFASVDEIEKLIEDYS
ncbi:peroxiredoxin [Paenibacillus cellulosilyticus]|uniref:Peroxiredoxin n=1 Tax=Paenibacillus cellulosilyticus TaxID=375489 RepID=A0A2V2YC86_9BACL|nr:redoxin domain-containing protein [Paenibacillus cellulosilyticus]PWV89439.1 peroxiredoxin [Paenibacillus cellulosilyticus]QKS47274.1 redoxin domain-containing protein [Paenibacillus cellulosilyticus]